MLKSSLVGIVLSLVGYKLLRFSMSHLDWQPIWINLSLAPPMAGLGFLVHKVITWRDRMIRVKTGVRRWSTTKLMLGAVSQAAFFLLVGALGFPVSFVRGGTVIALALPTYVASNGWAFKEHQETEKA